MVWEEEITFFFSLPTITLALHTWYDFKLRFFGLWHGTVEEMQMGKVSFGDLSHHLVS